MLNIEIMKRALIIGLMGLVGLMSAVRAQTDVTLDPEVGGRLSLSFDKKLAKGLHLTLREQVWMDNNFASFDRFQSQLSLSYKVSPELKVSLGYAMINSYSSSDSAFKSPRHRLMADVAYTYRFGDWSLSLRERVQGTYRSGQMNEYQAPRMAWMLKSRLKLTYKGFRRWEPYGYVEMRNTMNAPVIKANWDGTYYVTDAGSRTGEAGWFLDGFSGWYVNRWRGALGVEYRLNKENRLEVALLADWLTDKEVDANAEGTKLKSYERVSGFKGWLVIGYSYSF